MYQLDDEQLDGLCRAITWSEQELEPFLQHRADAVRAFAGPYYGDGGSGVTVPINLMEFALSTFERLIVPENPRVHISTKYRHLKSTAAKFKQACNALFEEIDLGDALAQAFADAWFGWGIIKTGVAFAGEVEVLGYRHDLTQPFADPVSLDDFVMDMAARRMDQTTFQSDAYWVDLEWAREFDGFDKEARQALEPGMPQRYSETGVERLDNLTRWHIEHHESYYEKVRLRDVWLPRENRILTVADGSSWKKRDILKNVEWEGPETGPYDFLSFQRVPDQIIPKAPSMSMIDLHQLANALFRKLERQAERQKDLLVTEQGNSEDLESINNAYDGQAVALRNAAGSGVQSFGGPNQMNLAFFMTTQRLFMDMNGGLDTLAGLGAGAETLGQEKMINEAAGTKVKAMQKRFVQFTKRVMRKLCWYEYSEPVLERKLTLKHGHGPLAREVETTFGPMDKEADFIEYDLSFDPYSQVEQSPGERLAVADKIMATLGQFMPIALEQGIAPNLEGYIRLIAELTNSNELEELVTFANPAMQELTPLSEQAGRMPANTKRTYERVSKPGMTRQGHEQAMIQQLMGGDAKTPGSPMGSSGMGQMGGGRMAG